MMEVEVRVMQLLALKLEGTKECEWPLEAVIGEDSLQGVQGELANTLILAQRNSDL